LLFRAKPEWIFRSTYTETHQKGHASPDYKNIAHKQVKMHTINYLTIVVGTLQVELLTKFTAYRIHRYLAVSW
jgi:hypothetical protein